MCLAETYGVSFNNKYFFCRLDKMKSRSTSSAIQQQPDDKPLVVFMIRDADLHMEYRGLMRSLHLMGFRFKTLRHTPVALN